MSGREHRIPRRRALKVLGGVAVGGLAGCVAPEPQGPQILRVPLEQLPEGEHVRFLLGAGAVDVVRDAAGVTALSLSCTHFGCEVRWFGERQRYMCPCHDGIYAADGRVLAGPPPRSLDRISVRIEAGEVVIGSVVDPSDTSD